MNGYGTHRYTLAGNRDPWRTHKPRRPTYLPRNHDYRAVVYGVVMTVFVIGFLSGAS